MKQETGVTPLSLTCTSIHWNRREFAAVSGWFLRGSALAFGRACCCLCYWVQRGAFSFTMHMESCGHMLGYGLWSLLAYGILCSWARGLTQPHASLIPGWLNPNGAFCTSCSSNYSWYSCRIESRDAEQRELYQVTCKAEKENTWYFEGITHMTPVLFKF